MVVVVCGGGVCVYIWVQQGKNYDISYHNEQAYTRLEVQQKHTSQ